MLKSQHFKKVFWALVTFSMIFSVQCTDMGWENQDETKRQRRSRPKRDSLKDKKNSLAIVKKAVCEDADSVIYTNENCDNIVQALPVANVNSQDKQPVDILFVLDTRSEMQFYFKDIFKTRFKNFISTIDSYLDWHLLYTHTDYYEGNWLFASGTNGKALQLESTERVLESRVLKPTTPNYKDVFLHSITHYPDRNDSLDDFDDGSCNYPPYCQNNDSRPFAALKAAFTTNKHLTREGASLVAIIISNTDNPPLEEDEPDEDTVTAKQVLKEFEAVHSSKDLFVFNIIILPDDTACLNFNESKQSNWLPDLYGGKNLSRLAKQAGGGNFSICAEDYTKVATSIVHLITQ